jgi:hypothetical protein
MPINSIALLARDNDVDVLISAADRDAMPVDRRMEPLLVTYPRFGRWLPVRGLLLCWCGWGVACACPK